MRPDLSLPLPLPLPEQGVMSKQVHPEAGADRSCLSTQAMNETVLSPLIDLRRQFLAFLEQRVQDRALAEDLLQSAYVRALEAAGHLRQNESAVAWFYRILRNAIIDHYRRRTTENLAFDRWARELETEYSMDPLLNTTSCQCIAAALDILPGAYASLLREVDLSERKLSDWAASNGISAGNAAVRAHRARAALRKQLIRCCGTCATHGCLDCQCTAAPRQPISTRETILNPS